MRKILAFSVLFISLVIMMLSCENNDYDFNKIEPGKQIIYSGPSTILANGVTSYEYVALTRGGSTYEWQVISGPIDTMIQDTKRPFKVSITALIKASNAYDSQRDTMAMISVTETTKGGIRGTPGTYSIKIRKYCDLSINNFLGIHNSQSIELTSSGSNDNSDYQTNITAINDTSLLIEKLTGNEYPVKITLSGDGYQIARITPFLKVFGTDTVNITGDGTYDGCQGNLYLKYKISINRKKYDILDSLFMDN